MSVDEYLYHCGDIRQMSHSRIPAAMQMAKEKCGLEKMGHRLIKHLSGGYQQRVGIAQAIIHNPPLVILDEPTNGLDPNQILEVRQLVRGIAEERAVLISTHILSEVQAICDRIEMIEHGRLVFSGSMQEFHNYAEPSTLVTVMMQAPGDEEFLRIPGIRRVERLTSKRIRLHFDSVKERSLPVIQRVMAAAVAREWQLCEIFAEKESLDTIFAKLSGKEI